MVTLSELLSITKPRVNINKPWLLDNAIKYAELNRLCCCIINELDQPVINTKYLRDLYKEYNEVSQLTINFV